MSGIRRWLPELAAAGVTAPAVGLFFLARLLGAHWNLFFLYTLIAAAFGLVLRMLASWKGWLEPSPMRRDATLSARVHTAVRIPVWVVGAAAVWHAVLPIQLGDELDSVRTMIIAGALLGVSGALYPVRHRAWTATVGLALVGGTLALDLARGLSEPAGPYVELHSPFASTATVFQGGGSPLLNHHAPLASQHFALDVVLAPNGSEKVGDPATLEGWACFGAPLLAPAAGTVVAARDDRPDMPIGQVDAEVIEGNHVVVDLGEGRFLMMAHLQEGSLEVGVGDTVQPGTPLGRCGNSGNTSQPHLHIQVQNKPTFSNADAELHTFPIRWAARRRGGGEPEPGVGRRNDELVATLP